MSLHMAMRPANSAPAAQLLPGVGSQRFLTAKVDRCITGANCTAKQLTAR